MPSSPGRISVAIIGAGIGGLSAAALLARSGHAVTVFERAPVVSSVGAGILLQPNGMRILDRLGIAERVRSLGAPVGRLLGTTARGRAVMDLRYRDLRPALTGVGVHRALLHAALLGCARDAGAALITGATVKSVSTDSERPRVTASGGPAMTGGAYDVVVVADGARSRLRSGVGQVKRNTRYPWGALWFVATRPPPPLSRTLRQVYDGTGTMLGFLPSGRVDESGEESVSLFWSIREREWQGGFDFRAWQRRVRGLMPQAAPVFDQIRSREDLLFAPYFDVDARRSARGVAILGDAAHAMSPQLGQGANLAMLDAGDLADAFGAAGSAPAVEAALERASARGRRRTGFYRLATRSLTPWFQSDAPVLSPAMGAARDLGLGIACRFPPTRSMMLRTLAGSLR